MVRAEQARQRRCEPPPARARALPATAAAGWRRRLQVGIAAALPLVPNESPTPSLLARLPLQVTPRYIQACLRAKARLDPLPREHLVFAGAATAARLPEYADALGDHYLQPLTVSGLPAVAAMALCDARKGVLPASAMRPLRL